MAKLINEVPKWIIVVLWVLANIGIFIGYFFKYDEGVEYHYVIEILGYALPVARASAAALNFNCLLVLLPVCRNCLSFLRGSCTCVRRNLRRQLDQNIEFHKLCAYGIVFHTIIHYYAHCYNMEYFMLAHNHPDPAKREFLQILTNLPTSNGNGTYINPVRTPNTNPMAVILTTWAGITGVVITLALILIYSSATEVIRRSYFEVFWFTHHLFAVFFIGLCLHGVGGLVRSQSNLDVHDPHECQDDYKNWGEVGHCPVPTFKAGSAKTWMWVIAPMILYAAERLIRFVRSFQKVVVTKVVRHPSKVIELQMQKKGFKMEAGQYIFMKCPSISHLEWHPFTLTSAPQEDFFSVHIRIAGDWTDALSKAVHADSSDFQETWTMPRIAVDGPFGTAAEDIFRYQNDVFVAAGIGVTPFASVLKDIWYRYTHKNTEMKLRKVHFYWICPDTNAFEWFADLLKYIEDQMSDAGQPDFLSSNIYLTRGWDANQALNIVTHDQDDVDPITGLKSKTQFGRPNWEDIFTALAEEHKGTSVGVFMCGPEVLGKELQKKCNNHSNLDAGTKFFFNKENF